MDYDVIVVGAGPAGATAARHTADRGLKTLVLEKERLPRYKPCGGGLTPGVRRLLDVDYADVVEKVVKGIVVRIDDDDPETLDPPGFRLEMVARDRFDQRLAEEAVRRGARLSEGVRVVGMDLEKNGVVVRAEGGAAWRGRVIVAADGAHSRVARLAGLALRGAGGMAIEAEIVPRDGGVFTELGDRIALGFAKDVPGYGWIFPKRDHLSVGVGAFMSFHESRRLQDVFERFKQRFAFLDGGTEVRRRRWPIPICQNLHPVNTERVCLVGDAASFVDPFTGEGIYYAVYSGMLAAETIRRELPSLGALTSAYSGEARKRIMLDFRNAAWLARAFYRRPHYFLRAMRRFIGGFNQVVAKKSSYGQAVAHAAATFADTYLSSVGLSPDRGAGRLL